MGDDAQIVYSDGRIETRNAQSTTGFQQVDGETDPGTLTPFTTQSIIVNFNSIADGRGFSLVKAIRQNTGYQGAIFASGDINPDHLSFAFQVGFDAVIVSAERWQKYGGDSWRAALNPAVRLSYSQTHSKSLQSIWQQRHRI